VLLESKGDIEDDSVPKSAVEKPPSTPEMSAREVEDMVDSMLRDSPLPDTERSEERLPEGDGSGKLPEEKDGEKLPEGGDVKLLEETPTGKLKALYSKKYFFFALKLIK
jgi:hypothetical protein